MIQRFLPILLIVIAIGVFFAYTSPAYTGKVASAKQEVASLDSALAAADAFKERENQLERERLALPADKLARLEAFLPDNVNNIQLILDLDALAARSGVRLSNFNVGEQPAEGSNQGNAGGDLSLQETETVGNLEITVTATGSYAAFRSFLEASERSLRLLDLVSVNVKAERSGVYTYDMTFRIYWLQ